MLNLKLERLNPKEFPSTRFAISNNIPYTAFYDCFKKTQKKIVPLEVEGSSEELIETGNAQQDVCCLRHPKRTFPHKKNVMVTIRTPVRTYAKYQRTAKLKCIMIMNLWI